MVKLFETMISGTFATPCVDTKCFFFYHQARPTQNVSQQKVPYWLYGVSTFHMHGNICILRVSSDGKKCILSIRPKNLANWSMIALSESELGAQWAGIRHLKDEKNRIKPNWLRMHFDRKRNKLSLPLTTVSICNLPILRPNWAVFLSVGRNSQNATFTI